MPADIVIIGSGIGGATVASRPGRQRREDRSSSNAASGCQATPETRDTAAIFGRGHFRPKEMWREAGGGRFNPGNYYYVGGNSKLYGAVLIRYRKEDFAEMEHFGGVSPAWPITYDEFEPWYSKAEQLFKVRGALGDDPTEPYHSSPYAFPPVPDEPPIARARRGAEERSACIRPRCRSASTSRPG